MRTGRPQRLVGCDYTGPRRYFLTFCTFHRQPHFIDAATTTSTLSEILRVAGALGFSVLAYCFMPDDVHLLVEGDTPTADARRFTTALKQHTGFWFARERGERLWQRYGYERVLRDSDDSLAVARYILENPVRAGLARAPSDYPFSGSPRYSMPAVLDATAWKPDWEGGSG
jgi:putative transposase